MKKTVKGQLFPTEITLQRMFAEEMEHRRSYFSEQNYNQRLQVGKEYMRRYHGEQILPFWRRRGVVERRIDRVEISGVPMAGVLDKIEWLDNGTLRIVDYKTGKPNPAKIAPPSQTVPNGGDYWRQLAFYRLLLEAANIYPEPVGHLCISWLEPDKRNTFLVSEIHYAVEEMQFVRDLIQKTWQNIVERRFTEGCGLPECPWCYMHQHPQASAYYDKVEEDLDDQ